MRSVKDPSDPTRPANRLPPPVVIRRKQIPPRSSDDAKQQDSSVADSSLADSSVADSSVSEEGARSGREEASEISEGRRKHSRRGESWREERSEPKSDEGRGSRSEIGERARNWGFLSKSASTNGTTRVFADTSGGTSSSSTSSSSYERDLQSLLSRPCERSSSSSSENRREAGTSAVAHFGVRISDSTSSDQQEDSELSSEERDALIEGVKTPSSVCRNRIPKFGARRRIVAATGSSGKDYHLAGDRLLGRHEDPCCGPSAAKQQNIHVINDFETEDDTFPGDPPCSSQKATSAPTTLSLGRKLTSWTKEGKDLLVKSVASANTLAPTTMTCIKSPRAMSEHLLGQLEVPVPPAVLGALRVKGGSLREGDRGERMSDVPRQRWSSVRVKGGSTKSLLLENGGPQPPPLKGALRKEVFLANNKRQLVALIKTPLISLDRPSATEMIATITTDRPLYTFV